MPAQAKKKTKSNQKPVQKRVALQKPERTKKVAASKVLADGFTRINESKIRKVYN
jgi:hypothetical protein